LLNYTIVTTFLTAALEVFNISYKIAELFDEIVVRIQDQSMVNEGATELLEFWTILSYLIDSKKLDTSFFLVENANELRIANDDGSTKLVTFSGVKKLLFIKPAHVHKEYLISARTQGLQRTLDSNSMKYYLKISKAFVGEVKAKKHNGIAARFLVFDTEMIPSIDLEVTNYLSNTEPELFS
jgi:hypothetical protein